MSHSLYVQEKIFCTKLSLEHPSSTIRSHSWDVICFLAFSCGRCHSCRPLKGSSQQLLCLLR